MQQSILFVDDDELDLENLRRATRQLSLKYRCIYLDSYEAAYLYLKNNPVSFLVTDYYLGDGDAMELLREFPSTTAIILCGSWNMEIIIEALEEGAYDFIVKDCEGKFSKLLPILIERFVQNNMNQVRMVNQERKLQRLRSA